MKDLSVWVVIGAYNEAAALPKVLEELTKDDPSRRLVVVDDGSSDDTSSVSSRCGAYVLSHPVNLGQGAALATGIEYALKSGANVIVTFDADGQMLPEDIEPLVKKVTEEGFDVALGSRFLGACPEGLPAGRKIVLKLATVLTRLTTGLKITDTHNGVRAFKAEAAARITIAQNRMAHASEILSQIARKGMSYCEVPVTIRYTKYSRSKGQSVFNLFNILYELFTGGSK
jgi:glycosyltransferase involved in cell wall biosynthesis